MVNRSWQVNWVFLSSKINYYTVDEYAFTGVLKALQI